MNHPLYPISDWKAEVSSNNTNLGYHDWLFHSLAGDDDASVREIEAARLLSAEEKPRREKRAGSPYDDVWAEHDAYGREDWRSEVADNSTTLGYWPWVESKLIAALEDGDVKDKAELDRAIAEIGHFLPVE